MKTNDFERKPPGQKKAMVYTSCPHCGKDLSPWEQVLLGVDRALMCKHCWYRIILDVRGADPDRESHQKGQPT